MNKFEALSLSEKLADILVRYDLSGPTAEVDSTGSARQVYLLTKAGRPLDTRRVIRESDPDGDHWYAESVPFYAQHKSAYYAEAVKRTVTGAVRLPVTE